MWILIVLVIALALLLGRVYFLQDDLIFPLSRDINRTPGDAPFNWEYKDVYVDVNGMKTHGWLVPLENARGYALFSHGNAGNIADRLESIQLLRRMGFSVLGYDYGGYGYSEGHPSEKRIYADVEAMWQYLTGELGVAPDKIVIFGRSLGGAAAVHLASKVQPAAVVLESTFTSIPDVVRGLPLGFLLAPCVRHDFPSLSKIKDIHAPLLLIHSPEDDVIPYGHGRKLFEAANEPKTFLEIRGSHNDGFVLSMDVYMQAWEEFLSDILPRP
jgi:fermentation-respiration switch protein FrsA (DUF1100 family)